MTAAQHSIGELIKQQYQQKHWLLADNSNTEKGIYSFSMVNEKVAYL
jgi:hypothetical protein